jgi:hypothetical protein
VAQELRKSSSLLGRWSARWGWKRRVSSWDDEQDRIQRADRQRLIIEARHRHLQASIRIQELALARLSTLHEGDLTPNQVLRAWQLAVRAEREALEFSRIPDGAQGLPSDDPDAEADQLAGPGGLLMTDEFLRENPSKIGPYVDLVAQLQRLVGTAGTVGVVIIRPRPYQETITEASNGDVAPQ